MLYQKSGWHCENDLNDIHYQCKTVIYTNNVKLFYTHIQSNFSV
jgi:hypothetical protein